MAKIELKTKKIEASVPAFIASIENADRRADGKRLVELYERATGEEPKMWGPAIVGFGDLRYKYPDGREIDWMITGFSPRKQNLSLYVVCGSPKQPKLLAKLGKHSTSVSCLYIKRLADVDEKVLEAVIADAYKHIKKVGSCF
ncbi:MAG: hypothetical protein UZ17_ACD001002669 [Acidobacteria bacterium OLB17]|nr:MAG: hypothetical protein UZ17_ACD001002669 [Acidobacteria bacterium OLB17]MCZ2390890.1 DUF1801 domain-containing protein [Acidobacteriota bacterium]